MKERRVRDERRGEAAQRNWVSFVPSGGQGATQHGVRNLKRKEYVCDEAHLVQNRCDQQVFPPQELAVGAPGVLVRVEPAGEQKHGSAVALHHVAPERGWRWARALASAPKSLPVCVCVRVWVFVCVCVCSNVGNYNLNFEFSGMCKCGS